MRKVKVSLYKEKWNQMFIEEAVKLNLIFGKEIIDIYHIGSTAVPGLIAKPIIDIMPVVKDINNVDKYNRTMQEIGYEPKGANGIVSRRYYQKGGDKRSHHVHIYQVGSVEIIRHLAFRDYLIVHPNVMKRFGELKEKLARQFPDDIESYINGKNHFVKVIERKALEWYEDNQY